MFRLFGLRINVPINVEFNFFMDEISMADLPRFNPHSWGVRGLIDGNGVCLRSRYRYVSRRVFLP
jgi:hypothetical protein